MTKFSFPIYILSFAVSLLWASGSSAGKAFTYPTKPTTLFPSGKENVDVDLLRLHKKEIERTREAVPADLKGEERKTAVSSLLNEENRKLIKQLSEFKPALPAGKNSTVQEVSKKQAQSILDLVQAHPVVSDEASLKYETDMRQIGYCFGKAVFVHVELLRRQVDEQIIGKVFAIGPLIFGQKGWDFHVTTVVRAAGGGWWAIDGLDREVSRLEDWVKKIESWSQGPPKQSTLRFYFTDAVKLNPTPGAYSDEKLNAPHYRGFFRDLASWFAKNPPKNGDLFNFK